MNILDAIVNAQDGAAVQQLGSQVGLSPAQATAALSALMPVLAGGFQRNIQSQGGLERRATSSAFLVFGLIAGALAKLVMANRAPGGLLVTMMLGVAGALGAVLLLSL